MRRAGSAPLTIPRYSANLGAAIGTEFMPELFEGDFLYMPTTLPGLSIGKAQELLQQTDRLIATVPEVQRVYSARSGARRPRPTRPR